MKKLTYIDELGNIHLVRGDTIGLKFQRIDTEGNVITDITQQMWFTVKINTTMDEYEIQKTLNNGITFTPEDSYYHILINSSDTEDLRYMDYHFDIQVENNGIVATIKRAKLIIEPEVTFEGGNEND